MTPIERAARALFWSRGGGNWLQASQVEKDGWIKSARSMLEEIREPSEAMCQAARNAKFKVCRDGKDHSTVPRWQAMIDAALLD